MTRRQVFWALWGTGGLGTLLILFVPFTAQLWTGAIQQCRYEITFVDTTGKPVSGVALRVETLDGEPAYYFPVTDYLPGHMPQSNADGVLTFHHVSIWGETYGSTLVNVSGTYRQEQNPPETYVCRFFQGDDEIYRVTYQDLLTSVAATPPDTVTVDWDWSPYFAELVANEETRQATVDGEVRTDTSPVKTQQKHVRQLLWQQAENVLRFDSERTEPLEFLLVQRTVVLPSLQAR